MTLSATEVVVRVGGLDFSPDPILAIVPIPLPIGPPVTAAIERRCDGRVATIVGTNGPDSLTGAAGPDVIVALGGDDTVRGLGGADAICGAGRDVERQ